MLLQELSGDPISCFTLVNIFNVFLKTKILNMILAVLLSAFNSDNLNKFEKEEKDERIGIVIFNFEIF
jgi:hypothetical protein